MKIMITGIVLGAACCTAPAEAGLAHAPLRAWAHTAGVVDLGKNRPFKGNVADRLMIEEVLSRWGIAYDEGRIDVIRTLFVEDSRFSVLSGSATPVAKAAGLENIVEVVRATIRQQDDQRRHLISNFVIEEQTSSTARLLAYALVAVPGEPITLGATVIYSAALRKGRNGQWRFTDLVIAMDAYSGTVPTSDHSKPPAN